MLQRPSKSKTWANDEMVNPVEDNQSTNEDVEAGDSIDPSHTQRKKTKVDEPEDNSRLAEGSGDRRTEPMIVDYSQKEDNAEGSAGQDAPVAEAQDEPVSDADWLRSKTSRLLGLLDDDEQAEFNATSQQKAASNEAEPERKEDTRDAETVAQPNNATEADKAPEVDTNVELVRNSARLFVRNLPYDAKESDLESVFGPFGKIEEVSTV